MHPHARRCLELLLYAGAALLGGWLLLRFVLPGLAPFLLAFLLARLMEPAVRLLIKARFRRTAAAGIVTLALLFLLSFAAARLIERGVEEINRLAASLPELIGALERQLDALKGRLLRMARETPDGGYLKSALDAVGTALTSVPAEVSRALLELARSAAQRSPDVLLFLVTAGLGSFFLSASYPQVLAFLRAQLSPARLRQLETLAADLKQSCGGFLRAQALLMLITFAELLISLLLLGVPGAVGVAALTALVDAMPVFGVGTVLLPWAAAALLRGNTALALGLVVCFAVVSLVRSILQAKLLGDQIGLAPLPSLLAVYVGWKLCGVWGLLSFPLLLVTLKQLNDRGLLRLWRSV